MSNRTEQIVVSVIVVFAIFVLAAYIIVFHREPISGDPALWGQLGDYLGGTLNPFFGLLTTIFAFFAYRNTQEQLTIQKQESKNNKYTDLVKQFDIDLDKIIQSYIYRQRAHDVEIHGTEEVLVENLQNEKIYSGVEASKKYRDFLLDQKNLVIQNERDEILKKVTTTAIYHEIYRIRILIDYYLDRFPQEFKEQYLERIRMTLPFSIISCLVLMQYFEGILNKNNNVSDWISSINLKKYYVKNEKSK